MARVLVIEDNPANMKLACLLLRHAGHTVLCAVDAETGSTLARSEQPNLILMDMQLPGMDGLAATALLKQDALTAAIPVIALTALAMKADHERCRAAGCDGYIAKPLRYQELYAAIDALLLNDDGAAVSAPTPAPMQARASAVQTAAVADVSITNAGLVLIAEDNEINQKLILRQLALLGVAGVVAGNGQLALERWRTGRYVLLLTDLRMPELSGYALAATIRSEERGGARIPIVALTANAHRGEAEQCRLAGMDAYLSKPLRLVDLKTTLDAWLPARRSALQGTTDAATQPCDAVLDPSVLASAVGEDPAVIRGFLDEFRVRSAQLAGELIAVGTAGQAASATDVAHKLRSSSSAVGAQALAAVCARVEAAGRLGDLETLISLMPVFECQVDALSAVLDARAAAFALGEAAAD